MKKYIVGAVFGALFMFSAAAFANSGLKEIEAFLWPIPIQINANGILTTSSPEEVQVLSVNDQAYVPLRYVAEKLGATVNYVPERTDLAHPLEKRITIDSADSRSLNVKDEEGVVSLGNFQFTSQTGGTMLTFQMKQNGELPQDKPFLNLSFYDGQNKLVYAQAVTLRLYAPKKGSVQTLFVHLDTVLPAVDSGRITAAISKEAAVSEQPGQLTPLSDAPTYFMQLSMTDTQSGWAKGDATVLRTTDGGVTWLTATPKEMHLYGAGSSIANHDAAFVGNHAWVAKPPAIYNQESEAVVWHTDNGGETWMRVPLPLTEKWEQFSFPHLTFSDESHGFVLLTSGGADPKQSLYSTSDSGNHWNRVTESTGVGTILQGGFSFLDSQNGWITTFDKLFHTVDGGKTWTLSGEAPVSYSVNVRIIDDHSAYTLSLKKGSSQTYQIFLTTNSGRTWTLKSEFEIPDLQSIHEWQFLNLSDGWISDAYPGTMYATHDGGVTWTQLRSPD